jgi:hypothetical protein
MFTATPKMNSFKEVQLAIEKRTCGVQVDFQLFVTNVMWIKPWTSSQEGEIRINGMATTSLRRLGTHSCRNCGAVFGDSLRNTTRLPTLISGELTLQVVDDEAQT